MKLIRFFLIILVSILVLNLGLLVAASEDEIITEEAEHVHVNYIDNAIIPPFLGEDTVNRVLIYGDYLPLYLSEPAQFAPYPTSIPPYKNLWNSAQEVINSANNSNDPLHAQALNLRSFADAMIAMEQKESSVKYNLSQQDINFALNQQGIYFYEFNDIPPSSVWQYNQIESLQNPYRPDYLMQLDNTFIAPMNQWNSITYNPSEEYIEELDELLHPVPDMSFLNDVFTTSGPLGDMAGALADVANPYTFLPAIFMLGMDIYLQSQNEIGFLYPTTTGYKISPCPESGMVMLNHNDEQMVYNITGGESGSITNIPSGDFGTFFVDAVNSFSGGIRPTISLINDDLLNGGRVQYDNVPSQYQSQDYSLNLESHVGISQSNLELCDTVICKIQGSGTMIMLPFKIGCWFQCDQGQTGNIKSKTTIGVRFKDDEKYYTYDLADCMLENINSVNAIAADQDGILMWSGVVSINAEEYGKTEIEEVYLALSSSAKKTSGLNKVNCYTSLSFSPYFLNPIITLPRDIEAFPEEEVTFETELLESPANATVNVSWEIPYGSDPLEGSEVSYTFHKTGIYDCKLIVDPQYQPRPPAVEVTNPREKFWNTDAGKIIFPFQVKILPPIDLKVGWRLPDYVPLNTRNYQEEELYPGRKTTFNLYVTNEGVKDFHSSENQDVPLKLSLFIDNNYNHYFEADEKIWEEEIDDFVANSSQFFNVELLLSLDKKIDDTNDETVVYWSNLHDCQLQVSALTEEENQENNVIQDIIEFISSPELDFTPPDFAVENAYFSFDQYNNIVVNFDLAEKSGAKNIINKWNEYHEDDPFIPKWGPIPYELWLRNGRDVNVLLNSGEISDLSYHETKNIKLGRVNLDYIPAGSYSLYLGVNPNMLLPESEWQNNHGFMDWFTLTDNSSLPWYTKGGDRGHTGWKKFNLIPPLITDWVIELNGIPVDIVCNSDNFYVLTTSGTIEKYNASGELQYTVTGLNGIPLQSSAMLLLIYPDTENERLLTFSDDYRLVMIDTQSGNKIWTSGNIFTETTYGSQQSIREYSRSFDYDGYYLLAGWPVALYRFDSTMSEPILLWETNKKRYGEVFLLGDHILAGQYLYSLGGEELEHFKWVDGEVIRYQQSLFTNSYRYNYLSGQLSELKQIKDPGSIFSDKIIVGRTMQCLDYQGNQLWTLPDKIEQEYYADSTSQVINVRIQPDTTINLWNDDSGYSYCINQNYQLLAVDMANGQPVWYREFIETPETVKNLKEELPENLQSQLRLGSAIHQTPLNMAEGFAMDITRVIPYRNSLLVGTVGKKIYRLRSANLDHLEVQGYIPSVSYGPSRLKVRVQAFNEQGAEIPLEDKITVTGDYINQNYPRYYYVQEEISLSIGLPDTKIYSVDYPNPPSIVSNYFNFVDIQTLSPRVSIPLVIENIQSRPIIRKYKTQAGKETDLSMNDEAQLKYMPKNSNNDVRLYYSDYGEEDLSQVVYEHSYHIIVGIRDALGIAKDYDFIDLQINLPEGVDTEDLTVKINKEPYNDWSLTNRTLIINCVNAFLEQNTNHLSIIVLKSSD
ncbi:MAG TPA: hypothetical protein ENO17_02355 [Candidatus Atribacteria bacterium]|nr:hypothetical protein [Candidatus Atribacteria bacterium]